MLWVIFIIFCAICVFTIAWLLSSRGEISEEIFSERDILPGAKGNLPATDPQFAQFVTVNLTMMSGGLSVAHWNDDRTELEVSVQKPKSQEQQEQITDFIDKASRNNSVDIKLKWLF